MGLDGVDNGFMIFRNMKIPRAALLNRFSQVNAEGKFESSIEDSESRFAV